MTVAPDDADREQDRLAVTEERHDRMERSRRPIGRREQQLDEIARADHPHQATEAMTAGPANGSNERRPRRRPANTSFPANMAQSVSVAWLSESVISDHPGMISGLAPSRL